MLVCDFILISLQQAPLHPTLFHHLPQTSLITFHHEDSNRFFPAIQEAIRLEQPTPIHFQQNLTHLDYLLDPAPIQVILVCYRLQFRQKVQLEHEALLTSVVLEQSLDFLSQVEKPGASFFSILQVYSPSLKQSQYQLGSQQQNSITFNVKLPENSLLKFELQLGNLYQIQAEMSLQGNSPKPGISITSSRGMDDLGDLELPERSRLKIMINPLASQASLKESQNQEIDEELFNLELLPDSHILTKQNATITTSQTFTSQRNDSKNQPKNVAMLPEEATIKTTRNTSSNTKLLQLNANIPQKSKFTPKLIINRQQQSFNDNNENSQCLQNEQQKDIRRRIEQKIRKGYNFEKQGGGLKAKAQQLRRQNQLRQKEILQKTQIQQEKKIGPLDESKTSLRQTNQTRQKQNIVTKEVKIYIKLDNNEDNINKKAPIQPGQFEIKTYRQVIIQTIVHHYEREFVYNEYEISNDSIGRSLKIIQQQEEQPSGFSICSCFRSKRKPKDTKFNIAIAKRLVAISKNKVTNSQEQLQILKEIWNTYGRDKYSRYGYHWMELGFQGKDPFTDLRSTGILSLLQWLQFIKSHPKNAQQYHIWCLSHYYPMALTFIQITDIFLDLLSKGNIKFNSWESFQRSYNCLTMGLFQKIMERYKLGQLVPNFAQIQANEVKHDYKKLLAIYDEQFKKMR